MAANDFAAQNGTEKLSTNALATVNGTNVAADTIEVQRVKPGYGVDGDFRDVSTSFPLPVTQPDVAASGTLTAAAQTVVLALNGNSAASVQISGTWVGTITFEASNDGTVWNSINGVFSASSSPKPTATVNGLYRLTPAGVQQIRVIMTSFTSGSAAIAIRASSAAGGTFANQVLPVNTDPKRVISFHGRSCTFKTPGRAAVSQKIMSIHNATGSAVLVDIQRMRVDVLNTAVKAVTIAVPVIRAVRYTTVQTNGTVLAKGAIDTAQSSNASVTVTGDASADGTLSGTTLTLTPTGTLAQAYACRVFTAVGYEIMDTVEFFLGDTDITLRAGEGLAIFLDAAVVTTGIPATDFYIASVDWVEYTAV